MALLSPNQQGGMDREAAGFKRGVRLEGGGGGGGGGGIRGAKD